MIKSKKKGSLTEIISNSIKTPFDLGAFKKSKFLDKASNFKKQTWIPFSEPIQEALSLPGIPMGHISIVRGRSDTGKTTMMIEAAVEAQKMGILPVFIITEMKWSWEHAKTMGFELGEEVDAETGELSQNGFFMYVDRSSLDSIEDVAEFIVGLLNEQKAGKLPYDLLFLWDSVGSIPCQLSIDQGKNNPMWNAGAMTIQFGNFVNQRFPMSRKENYPFTNTLLVINKVGIKPADHPMGQPKMTNKTGDTMYWDASLVITFGNITNSGTSKIKAVKNKRNVEFAKRTKIAIDKIHLDGGIATNSTVIVTPHGFIDDTDSAINKYKKEYSDAWFADEPGGKIEIIEDNSEWNEGKLSPLATDFDEIESPF